MTVETENEEVVSSVRRVTFASMAINVALAVVKAAGGLMFSSQALLADAIHSLSDLVTDFAVVLGVRYWVAPADAEHPYGHGKIEALVTVFIALALVAVAWELGAHAVGSLCGSEHAKPPGIAAAAIAAVSVALKESLFRCTRRVARRVKSPALESNAWHHRSDALSSVPVAVAVAVAWFFPSLAWADAVGALVVGAFILHVSWELAWPALEELVDANMAGKSEEVAAVARKVDGVRGVHKVRVRRYGRLYQADLHIQVDAKLSIVDGHYLGHLVQEAVVGAGIEVSDVVVHVEPDNDMPAVRTSQGN